MEISFFVQCMLQDSCESTLSLFHSEVLEAIDCIRNLNKQRPEAVVWRCSVEKMFLEISQNSQETPVPESRRLQACNFITKEILAKVFSCEFCKISRNTFFYRTPPVAVSERLDVNAIYKHISRSEFPILIKPLSQILLMRLLTKL